MFTLTKAELSHLKDALEQAQAELEELEKTEDWYCTEVTDRIASALEIAYGHLGITVLSDEEEDEEDEDE